MPIDHATNDVTASEAACYVFCAKAWHLEHVLGHEPSTGAVENRKVGTSMHELYAERAAATRDHASRLLAASVILLAIATGLIVAGLR